MYDKIVWNPNKKDFNITPPNVQPINVRAISSYSELPENPDPNTMYITMDNSDLYINTNDRWDVVDTCGHIYDNKPEKNVPFDKCPNCGGLMKSFMCDYCSSDFTYLR